MAYTSTINSIYTYILAHWPAFLPAFTDSESTQVYDGDPRVYSSDGYLAITGFKQQMELAGIGQAYPTYETVEVSMVARAWQGDTDQAAARANAVAVLNGCIAAWFADPSLGGVVNDSNIASAGGEQGATDKGGVVCEIEITFTCSSRLG